MNLYLVNKFLQDTLDQFMDYETGEISEEGAKKIEALGLKKEELIDEMIKVYKNNQMLVDGINAEMKRLQDRSAKLERSMNSIMKMLRPNLTEGEKIVTPEYELKWTTSTKLAGVDLLDPELTFHAKTDDLHKFVKAKTTYSFDKAELKKALKEAGNKYDLPFYIFIEQTKNPKIN